MEQEYLGAGRLPGHRFGPSWPIVRFELPNGHAVQLRPTALTANVEALRPPPERYHGFDWKELLGDSCNRWLGGERSKGWLLQLGESSAAPLL
jgi:hypothetical protein